MAWMDWFRGAQAGLGAVVGAATAWTAAVVPGGSWRCVWSMQASAAIVREMYTMILELEILKK